jgi:hypothetical protein
LSVAEIGNRDETVEEMPWQEEQLRFISMDHPGQTFNPWLAVDIVGSPRLTGLIGALTLELCEGIPELHLTAPSSEEDEDACESTKLHEGYSGVVSQHQRSQVKTASHTVSFSIAALSTYFAKQKQRRLPRPLDELYSFPGSQSETFQVSKV